MSVGVALVGLASALRAQVPTDSAGPRPIRDSVYVRHAGPGRPGRVVRDALRGRRAVLRPQARVTLGRTDTIAITTILLGPELAVDGVIRGDLIVIGGDAFVHPGAVVEGRAIGIGGCIYESKTRSVQDSVVRGGVVRGGVECFPDETFDVVRDPSGALALSYRSLVDRGVRLVEFPLGIGLRIPSYDRVNGLSLAVGPRINLDTARIVVEPLVTYRSNLGDFDPAVVAEAAIGRALSVDVRGQRGTFTNEWWIRDSLVNSVTAFVSGRDARNYYRADRFEGYVRRRWEGAEWTVVPYLGALTERAWSAGLDTASQLTGRAPWSIMGRGDTERGMRRPNPHVLHGRITSALAGSRVDWESPSGVRAGLELLAEASVAAPEDRGFLQGTLDADVTFPVIRDHTLRMQLHALATASDSTPAQRYSYVGGSGSIPTLNLLVLGGDRLFHLDSRYNIPLTAVKLPFVGSPLVTIRHVVGSAGVQDLPRLVQNVGVRATLSFIRAEIMYDPASGDSNASFSLALGR